MMSLYIYLYLDFVTGRQQSFVLQNSGRKGILLIRQSTKYFSLWIKTEIHVWKNM